MRKRPLVIKIISILYFLSPIGILLEIMFLFGIKLSEILLVKELINWHVVLMAIWTPVVGYGVWKVKHWGYYQLLFHSLFVFMANIFLYSSDMTRSPLYVIILFNMLLIAVVVMFVRKEVKSPYFNPNIRWWEQAVRFYFDGMRILVRNYSDPNLVFEANSFDVSETGAFIVTDRDVKVGEKYTLEMHITKESILYATGEIVWANGKDSGVFPVGFGCKFIGTGRLFKKRIRHHMKDISAKIRDR
jgi:hypothetical protein